ncbi:patatin-like phospholipase family protein [Zavarzinia sp. CC-PAN008]|uniref:patatin-like phospholipase family protein n=1 Tax=Zavarzinia sp. CC-PAN008 TaxID=3243332 RepID=UPI003F749608
MTAVRRINLALQGGGSHGAFTWGVIDRLLEDPSIEIEGVVGTSAGAMNAAVLTCGLAAGGREGARKLLETFWKKISDGARFSPLQQSWMDRLMGNRGLEYSPIYHTFDTISRMMSPYQMNPFNYNPLKQTLAEVLDTDMLHHERAVKLFICASNVLTGRIRVFRERDVTVDAVLASACLPFLFQAVEVDGEHYWDGGYMGNPPIYPLIYNCDSRDVLIIQINPIQIPELPTTAQGILDRINTLSFNSSLMREMRAIGFVTSLIDRGFDDGGRLKRMLIHSVDAEDVMNRMGVSSKLNADWSYLRWLFELGRERAEQFLSQHSDKIGRESSTDINTKFL